MAKWDFYTKEVEQRYSGYQQKYWQRSFVDSWEKNAEVFPNKEAFVDSKMRLNWSQVKTHLDRLALGLLELGLKRDEVIAVQLPYCVELALIRGAREKAGVILLQMAATLRHEEAKHLLKSSGAVGIIIPLKYRDFNYYTMVEEIRPDLPHLRYVFVVGDEVPEGAISIGEMLEHPLEKKYASNYFETTKHSATEVAILEHTTGTTGLPKLVPFSSGLLEYDGYLHYRSIGEKLYESDVSAIICPALTGPNILLFYAATMVGAKIIFMEHFRPEEALSLIEREKATVTGVVPTMLAMMVRVANFDKYDLSSLRFVICSGASLVYALAREAEEKFGCPIVQHYGSNEAGVVTGMQPPELPRDVRLLTVGKPPPENEVKIVDNTDSEVPQGEVGVIMVKGPGCSYGYYKDRESTLKTWTEDGWYKMGDLGKFDEQGNLLIVGRERDMIIRGGQNIYPIEIENMLLTHPSISQVAVVKMPDPIMGEKACAYVIPKPGQEFTFDEMTSFLKEKKIALYKLPERMEIMERLPMSGEQKVSKKDLENDVIQKLKAEGKI